MCVAVSGDRIILPLYVHGRRYPPVTPGFRRLMSEDLTLLPDRTSAPSGLPISSNATDAPKEGFVCDP
jgi:hypothetical protein